MTTTQTKVVMTMIIISYIIIASIGCSPLSVTTCEILNTIGIDSQIALTGVDGKNSYGHIYVIIDNEPYEPRYLGLYLRDDINYDNPYDIYNTTDEYTMAGYTVFPDIVTIINAVGELI